MLIPLWSQNSPEVKKMLFPIEPVDWSNLSDDEKTRMWKYMEDHLFNPEPGSSGQASFSRTRCSYEFPGDMWENDHLVRAVSLAIEAFNQNYKKQSFARRALSEGTFDAACHDFYEIFMTQGRDVVFELISIFSNTMVLLDAERIHKKSGESESDFEERVVAEKWKRFDAFYIRLNEVFQDFGINYQLTRDGIIPADEPIIIEKIYEPALKKLSNRKWSPVNRDLRDSFHALNDDKDGSGALTHALAALQGFLQILVRGKVGKGDTGALISEAIKKRFIPNDDFSKKIINDMNSFWARERQERGDPHPKKEYATKEQAKLVINLIIVFIDHAL